MSVYYGSVFEWKRVEEYLNTKISGGLYVQSTPVEHFLPVLAIKLEKYTVNSDFE